MEEKKEEQNRGEVAALLQNDTFAAENGILLEEFRPGYAKARMALTPRHRNGFGAVQGGAVFTLADFAFAAAANATGSLTVSSGATIGYFRPPQGDFVTAVATQVASGHRLCTYNVDVFDGEGNLAARCTVNGYITGKPLVSGN